MNKTFKIALKAYGYLMIVYFILFWVLMIIDDWVFIEKYWSTRWFDYLTGWTLWCVIFGLGISLYYWGIVSVAIVFYHKLIKGVKK